MTHKQYTCFRESTNCPRWKNLHATVPRRVLQRNKYLHIIWLLSHLEQILISGFLSVEVCCTLVDLFVCTLGSDCFLCKTICSGSLD